MIGHRRLVFLAVVCVLSVWILGSKLWHPFASIVAGPTDADAVRDPQGDITAPNARKSSGRSKNARSMQVYGIPRESSHQASNAALKVNPLLSDDDKLGESAIVTISGTVTGPGGPVPDVWIDINDHPRSSASATTDNSGFYSVTIETEGGLNMHAFPPLSTRLSQTNLRREGITGGFVQNFTVAPGYLLSVQLTDNAGHPLGEIDFQLLAYSVTTQPLPGHLPEYHLFWDESVERYEGVLPPDVYSVRVETSPAGYYPTTAVFDLRSGDQVTNLVLSDTLVDPTVYDPPDASKITVGPPDDLGEATVSGDPGAVLPTANVLVSNMNSIHYVRTLSEADGSFSCRIYAPAGSALMVQHGSYTWTTEPAGDQQGLINLYPATIIDVPYPHASVSQRLPFAAAGTIKFNNVSVLSPTIGQHIEAAWAITGTLGHADGGIAGAAQADPGRYAPGDYFSVEGTLTIYGHAINETTDVSEITANGGLDLLMLYNQQGQPIASENFALSTRLTASGFPIRQTGRASTPAWVVEFNVENLHHARGHSLEATLSAVGQLPDDLPNGIYRPIVMLDFYGVPGSTEWAALPNDADFRIYRLNEAALPPIVVSDREAPDTEERRLVWRLLMDDIALGTRGVGAREDDGKVALSSFIVAQGAPFIAPLFDARTGEPKTYRLEPFLPMFTFNISSVGRSPSPPLLPLHLPGGHLNVKIRDPDRIVRDLGSEPFAQPFLRSKTTRGGYGLNPDTNRVDHVYSLMTASDRFRVTFDQYGHYVITLSGAVDDLWGNHYTGGGTYDVWVAEPLEMDPGVLPGTPYELGDTLNPSVYLIPPVPARISWVSTLFPNSDPTKAIVHAAGGFANQYGYFAGQGPAFSGTGEYRVDLLAEYTDSEGVLYMGAKTWGGIVMTPSHQAQLIAHGRRGLQELEHIPESWFVFCRDLPVPPNFSAHTYAPYFNGDVAWTRKEVEGSCSGEALREGASVQDLVGNLEARMWGRANRMSIDFERPGTLEERFSRAEIPLFSSTQSGRRPQIVPEEVDQIAYAYFYSERPGVRVREVVTEDRVGPGYWRFDTLYDDQFGVGILGDLPNDFKFQYIGAVYRDLETGYNEYAGQGTGWILLSDDDPLGSRVMPPFAGPGNGGWTTEGGPLFNLKGEDIHIFILLTGTRPGAVLQVGDTFRLAGHIMPTLDSQVAFTVTAPSGAQHLGGGRANQIGYYFDPNDDFTVNEPGLWSVDVHVWHDGLCSGGATVPPYPSGNVLGSDDGRYWFYVVPRDAPRLDVSGPAPGFLDFKDGVHPVVISGTLPVTLTDSVVDYTISMPGFILAHGQVYPQDGIYRLVFDPVALHQDFPNLDLIGRDSPYQPGLADTFSIGLLLRGQNRDGEPSYLANTISLQGDRVFVGDAPPLKLQELFLPLILNGGRMR